jgi:hypothetical protein
MITASAQTPAEDDLVEATNTDGTGLLRKP